MNKPILLIGGCHKYLPYLKAALRRMKCDQWELIGFIGGCSENIFDPETRILSLTAIDTYEALPAKVHAAYQWVFEHYPESPGVFKTDDDLLFHVPQLAEVILQNVHVPFWGVVTHTCNEAQVNTWRINARFDDKSLRPSHQAATYCYGWGYWLNRKAWEEVVKSGEDYAKSVLEDVCTGFVLNRAGIIPEKRDIFYREVLRDQNLLNL